MRAFCCNIDSDGIMGVSKEPVIFLSVAPNPVCLGAAISWDMRDSYAPGSTITSWDLDYGDGEPGASGVSITTAQGSHTYAAAGLYTITATVEEGSDAHLTQEVQYQVEVVDCTSTDGTWTYAATDGNGVYFIDWAAASPAWEQRNTGLEGAALYVRSMAIKPATMHLPDANHELWITTQGGVYKTHDGGRSWIKLAMGDPANTCGDDPSYLEADLDWQKVVFDPLDGEVVYVLAKAGTAASGPPTLSVAYEASAYSPGSDIGYDWGMARVSETEAYCYIADTDSFEPVTRFLYTVGSGFDAGTTLSASSFSDRRPQQSPGNTNNFYPDSNSPSMLMRINPGLGVPLNGYNVGSSTSVKAMYPTTRVTAVPINSTMLFVCQPDFSTYQAPSRNAWTITDVSAADYSTVAVTHSNFWDYAYDYHFFQVPVAPTRVVGLCTANSVDSGYPSYSDAPLFAYIVDFDGSGNPTLTDLATVLAVGAGTTPLDLVMISATEFWLFYNTSGTLYEFDTYMVQLTISGSSLGVGTPVLLSQSTSGHEFRPLRFAWTGSNLIEFYQEEIGDGTTSYKVQTLTPGVGLDGNELTLLNTFSSLGVYGTSKGKWMEVLTSSKVLVSYFDPDAYEVTVKEVDI